MSMLFKRIKDWAISINAFRTGDVIPVDGPSGNAKMDKDDLLRVTAENVVNDLDASATSALLPYGKTFALQKSNIIGLKFGYVEDDGTIRSSMKHKYCEIPLHCVKEVKVTLPGGGLSSLYAIVVKNESGTFTGYAPINLSGEQTISIPAQLGGTLYLNFFSSFGDATFSVKYYGLDEVVVQKPEFVNFPYKLKNYLDVSLLNSYQPYGKTISITRDDLKGLKSGYIDDTGTWRSSMNHKYCEIPLCGVKNVKVTLPGGGLSSLYAIVVKKSDGTFVYGGSLDVSTEQVVSVSPQIGGTLYLNFFSSPGNITFYVEHYKADDVFGVPASNADFESLIIPSRIAYGRKITIDPALAEGFENGIIKDDGSLSTGHGRKHVTLPMRGVKSIKIKNAAGGSISGFSHVVLEFPNSQYRAYCPAANSGDLTSGKIMLDWLGKIHLNYYSQSASIGATWEIEYFSEEEMQTHDDQKRRLVNLVRKPLNLGSSDKAMFAGSSVMRGFTSGSTTTNYNLPYWVNEKFNFSSYVNVAVGGSTIASVAGYTQLISQLSGLDTSYTLLVMYAGQNDYALGVNATDFRNAVKDLCDYINANASNTCKVVFITPIDDGGHHMYENTRYTANDEDDYRYIIQEEMMKNDTYARFNIVQGRDFGFPSMASSASAISTFFGDRLHPTELGYKTLMANGFLNAIG